MGRLRNKRSLTEEEQVVADAMKIDLLKQVKVICEKHKVKWNLGWGTLLGAYRDQSFIPNDTDIDVDIDFPSTTPAFFDDLRQIVRTGYKVDVEGIFTDKYCNPLDLMKAGFNVDGITQKDAKGNDIYCDLYFLYPTGNGGRILREWFNKLYFPPQIRFPGYATRHITFLGEEFPIPHDPELYLAHAYGPTWNQPNVKWSWGSNTEPIKAPPDLKGYKYNAITKKHKLVIK
jgi:hypothetical protein